MPDMPELKLIIGNRNYSSWSLRAWLAMRQAGLAFSEEMVPLDQPETRDRLWGYSAAGRVPVLYHGDLIVWDTLAIIEYLAETFPEHPQWPADTQARALARSVSAEMHAGFASLRCEIPMNIRADGRQVKLTDAAEADVARILELWQSCLDRRDADGPYLFGPFCAADAMFAPIVSRFRTYGIVLTPDLQDWSDAVWTTQGMSWWRAASEQESWTIPGEEVG